MFYLIQNNCQLKDFKQFAEEHTKTLCDHIDKIATDENRPTYYVQSSKVNKNEIARNLYKENPIDKGLVCSISTMEICDTVTVKRNKKTQKLEVTRKSTKCKYYYLYMIDEEFGWMYFKIQT